MHNEPSCSIKYTEFFSLAEEQLVSEEGRTQLVMQINGVLQTNYIN